MLCSAATPAADGALDRSLPGAERGMFAIHAAWSVDHRLHLWAEGRAAFDQAGRAGRRRPIRPRQRTAPAVGVHPFAATDERLAAALAPLVDGPRGAVDQLRPEGGSLTLLLPTDSGRPVPSPELAGGTRDWSTASIELASWEVATWAFVPRSALDLLLSPVDGDGETVAGASLRYFRMVALLALELVARGRVVPGLTERRDGHLEARWLPAPGAGETDRIGTLARSMPPICRAETLQGAERRGRSGGEVLRDFLGVLADAIVRGALAEVTLPPRGARRGARTGLLTALTSRDASVGFDGSGLSRLADALAAWRRSTAPTDRPFRTCFRLTPPTTDDRSAGKSAPEAGAWRLELLLQARDDPSLLLPAAKVWGTAREEHLLADLGRASRLYPSLDPALDAARPTRLELDTTGAHAFLREGAPLLDEAGFGILLPAWWRTGRRLGARLRARSGPRPDATAGPAGLSLDAIVGYEWEIALGDETLSLRELQELARLKAPLIRVRGEWVEVREEEIGAALRLLEEGPAEDRAMSVRDVLRIGLGLATTETGLPVEGLVADGWLGLLASGDGLEQQLRPLPTPVGFAGTLRPYQERGLGWLAFLGRLGLGACLADDMGLGKTAQILALLVAERAPVADGLAPARPGPTLVVCPMSIVGNWQREAERFAPGLAVHVHHGSDRLDGGALAGAAVAVDLVITTYGLVVRDADAISAIRWGRIVLDEAQAIKNGAAQQTQAVRRLVAPQRAALTGTPIENRLSELWSIMDVLNPGLLGSAAAFRAAFGVPIERYRDDGATERLRRLTGPFILRRLKSDRSIIQDLPEKLEMTVYCNLTREQATLYQAIVDDMLERIASSEGIERRGLILATMLRLKQVCNHPAQLLGDGSPLPGRSGKLARLEEILEEVLAEGDRAICFTQFAEFGTLLQRHLLGRFGREVLYLHGGTPKQARDEMVARFQSANGPALFLLSLKAGGTGLNLTAANHVIHVDRWWNPAVENQATDRAYRIGQRRNVQVRKFVCVGTLEERIAKLIESKRDLAERIVGTGEGWLTELSTADLRDLVALSPDAVAEG